MKKTIDRTSSDHNFIPVYDLLQNWDRKSIQMHHLRFEKISFSQSSILCYEVFNELDICIGVIVATPETKKYVYEYNASHRLQLMDYMLDEISKFIKTLLLIDHIKAYRMSEYNFRKGMESKSDSNKTSYD